jgi:hypothetical protein
MKPHKHAELIKLMADGVLIERLDRFGIRPAVWDDFRVERYTFRISPNQPTDADGWIPYLGNGDPASGKLIEWKADTGFVCSRPMRSDEVAWNGAQRIVAYRIHKEPVKVEMWKFAYQIGLRKDWVETENFYPNAEAVAQLIKAEQIVRIDGTRIEVTQDE